ncbi:arginase family protein [Candidatus Pacearchaeota archaeon]|nr:arginase family protein [Candidatus Pacearchaeota archaeon]
MQIIKVPGINSLGRTNGCEKAGNAILEALKEVYSNEQGKIIDTSLLDLEEIHLDNENLDLTGKLIYENSLEVLDKDRVIFLGGDHSISYYTGKAFLEHCREMKSEPCLIVFDSHPDLMKPSRNPTNEEWLRALIERGFPARNILIVGLRNCSQEELRFIAENKIRVINLDSFVLNTEDICDTIMEFSSGKELYISIDIGVVDPGFAPGTHHKEPGGLTSREIIYLAKRLNKIKGLKVVDIVEINPDLDKDRMTVKLGAKILSEFL